MLSSSLESLICYPILQVCGLEVTSLRFSLNVLTYLPTYPIFQSFVASSVTQSEYETSDRNIASWRFDADALLIVIANNI